MFAIFLHDNRELVVLCRLERPLLVSEEAGTVSAAQPVLDAVLSCGQRVDRSRNFCQP